MSQSPLASMTGFGRATHTTSGQTWVWELRGVNARGLDIRLKLPPGWEPCEQPFRHTITQHLTRGTIQAQLTTSTETTPTPTIRTDLLEHLLTLATTLAQRIPGAPPPRAEALLALPGVLRATPEPDPDPSQPTIAAITTSLATALQTLTASRQQEGRRLHAVLTQQVDQIATLAAQARGLAAAQPRAQQTRLRETLRNLLETTHPDEQRLAQEVALLASRADVTEEIDRLESHVAQARTLLAEGRAIGRRLDFLTQEFMREANTLCSKAATTDLTTTGLNLKSVIDQLREQVQNVE